MTSGGGNVSTSGILDDAVRASLAIAFARAATTAARALERYARAWHDAPGLAAAWRAYDCDPRRALAVDFGAAWRRPTSSKARDAWRELRRALLDLNIAAHALGLEWRAPHDGEEGAPPEALALRVPTLVGSTLLSRRKNG